MTEEEITVQIEENPAKAENILRPITYFSWLLGVGAARPLKCPIIVTLIIRLIHFCVCSVIVAYGAIDFFTFGTVYNSDIFKIMYYMSQVATYVSSYYYVFHGIGHYSKWPKITRKMESLDRKIRREIPIENGPVRNSQILATLITCILGPASLVVHSLYYYFTRPEDIFTSDLLLYYTISQTLINCFVFNVVVYFIRQRLKAINELLEQLDLSSNIGLVALKIRRIRELHSDACDLVAETNDVYGVYLLFVSANSFTMVVAKLFRVYMSVVEKHYEFIFINNIIWMVYLGQFAITCYVCTLAIRESNRTGLIVHTLTTDSKYSSKLNKLNSLSFRRQPSAEVENLNSLVENNSDNDRSTLNFFGMESLMRANLERDCIRNEVMDFFSQMQQHRVVFSACDFFQMDNSLLTGFLGVITTYLIIVVQFYQPENRNDTKVLLSRKQH